MLKQQNCDSSAVQNQAANQTVHGPQYFGSVSIHNVVTSTANTNEVAESLALPGDLLASLAFPGMLDRRESIAQPHGDTCKWIFDLDQYRTWREQPCGQLWISGSWGTGKSTLMAFLNRTLHQQRHAEDEAYVCLNYFFYEQGSVLQHSLLGMLRSLMNQLLRQCPEAGADVITSYHDKCAAYGARHQMGAWQWQQSELERLLSDTLLTASSHRQVIIFVDAIDEAGDYGKSVLAVATYLDTISYRAHMLCRNGTSLGLKLCISARYYSIAVRHKTIVVYVEQHNADDIKAYVHDEVDRVLKTTGRQTDKDRWNYFRRRVVEGSRGWFDYVRLVMRVLIEEFEAGRLPQNYDELYDEAWPRRTKSWSSWDQSVLYMPSAPY